MKLPKLLFSFYGRVGRGAYIGGLALIWALLLPVVFAVRYLVGPVDPVHGMPPLLVTFLLLVLLVLIWAQQALAAKRFHDLGKSGWFRLLLFTPVFPFAVFYLLLTRGDETDNQYGASHGPATAA